MLELSTIDILRSLNFLLKFVIVNDAFPRSCRLVGVEIVILHFGNLIPSVYTFSAEEFYPRFPLMFYQEYHLSQCAKWCNPVISKVVASYNHTCLHEHLGSILLWLCFPVFNRFSSISANNESLTMRHVPFGKGWSGKTCLLFVKVMNLPWYFLRISVSCSLHDATLFNGGMTLFNSGFWTSEWIAFYPLVTSDLLLHWSLLMVCSGWLGDWSSKCW